MTGRTTVRDGSAAWVGSGVRLTSAVGVRGGSGSRPTPSHLSNQRAVAGPLRAIDIAIGAARSQVAADEQAEGGSDAQ